MIPVELLNTWGGFWFGLMTRTLIETSALLGVMLVLWLPLAQADVGAACARAFLSGAAQVDHPDSDYGAGMGIDGMETGCSGVAFSLGVAGRSVTPRSCRELAGIALVVPDDRRPRCEPG